MAAFIVLRLGGKQYKLTEGSEFLVDKLNSAKVSVDKTNEKKSKFPASGIVPEVLLYTDGNIVKVGKPVLNDVKVDLKVLSEEEKGEKIDIFKYKSKSRYRKHTGFRAKYTRMKVSAITSSK